MENQRILVFITTPDQAIARQIADQLVEKQFAACVNIIPDIQSIYRWQGKVQKEGEVLLIVKTRLQHLHTHLIPEVKVLHPYTNPEIIALPILDGSEDYLDWIDQSTQPE
jgi:periplasmic divalent cation tolerance protein